MVLPDYSRHFQDHLTDIDQWPLNGSLPWVSAKIKEVYKKKAILQLGVLLPAWGT